MSGSQGVADGGFARNLPERFANAIADARGAIAAIESRAVQGGGRTLIDPRSLRHLHEMYRLRIELELEAASVLWQTAEAVCALADALEALSRRRSPESAPPASWLPGTAPEAVGSRRARLALGNGRERKLAHWPDLDSPAAAPPAARAA